MSDEDEVELEVRMIHTWDGLRARPVRHPCIVRGRHAFVVFGISEYRLALSRGHLMGPVARRRWRMHRTDLRKVRELAGWLPFRLRCPGVLAKKERTGT